MRTPACALLYNKVYVCSNSTSPQRRDDLNKDATSVEGARDYAYATPVNAVDPHHDFSHDIFDGVFVAYTVNTLRTRNVVWVPMECLYWDAYQAAMRQHQGDVGICDTFHIRKYES